MKGNFPINIRLNNKSLIGPDNLLLTKRQFNKIQKSINNKTGTDLKLKKNQIILGEKGGIKVGEDNIRYFGVLSFTKAYFKEFSVVGHSKRGAQKGRGPKHFRHLWPVLHYFSVIQYPKYHIGRGKVPHNTYYIKIKLTIKIIIKRPDYINFFFCVTERSHPNIHHPSIFLYRLFTKKAGTLTQPMIFIPLFERNPLA